MTKVLALIGALVLGSFAVVSPAHAATATGQVTFVGTMSEINADGGLQMRFRFRMTNSSCSGVAAPTRWIIVKSGVMTAPLEHNEANTRAAYNTVMAAFLSGKAVQVDGIASCSASTDQVINLWTSAIGIF
jgi:hypothetical protein